MMLNRVSLNTIGLNRIGLNRIGKPSRGSSDRPYIDPEVLASLKAVCICYGKSNDDPDRAIVKNLVDPDNPFVISNAAFKLNSGFGKYETELSDTRIWTKSKDVTSSPFSSSYNGLSGWIIFANTELTNSADIPSFKIEVKGLLEGQELIYRYYDSTGQTNVYSMTKDGEYTLPADVRTAKPLTSNTSGFQIVKNETNTITITQIPSFQGAFVTDGIDDLITSTKTVQEMMGGSNEITVVSMIHQIDGNVNYTNGYTNYIRHSGGFIRNSVTGINGKGFNKTGIYGYTSTQLDSSNMGLGNVINNILGDKDDYSFERSSTYTLDDAKYSVQNFVNANNQPSNEGSSVAWYWTIIANKVLTTDQINQVIAYFNLDRTLNPDILCNTIKQGITNENHAEFGDRLIDYSGNGRNIQLNNIAWKGDSGIGKYEVDFLDSSIWESSNSAITSSKIDCKNAITHIMPLYYNVGSKEYPDIPSFKVIKTGADIDYSYIDETGAPKSVKIVDGVNILPASHNTLYSGSGRFCGFGNPGMGNSVTITQIPSHAGALCLDGVNDFGKVTGMPIYKDYTFISKYQRLSYREAIEIEGGAVIASKSYSPNQGAFIFNGVRGDYVHDCYSFGLSSSNNLINDKNLEVYYQTKYTNQGKSISSGTAADSDILWLGTVRDNDTRFINAAIYFLMSFPYSMSEFLIERQLKKHKLGTLYPDMVEFRPIIKQDDRIKSIKYYIDSKIANIGQYYPIGTGLGIAVETVQPYMVKSLKVNGVNTIPNADYKGFNARLDSKSPQKITMDIQVDSSLVQWNPVVESNAEYQVVDFYIDTYPAVVGNYYLISSKLRVVITTKGAADEVTSLTVNGVSLGTPSINGNRFTFNGTLPDKSPQNINIDIDEYIRFEDIVQPYPVLLRFNDENGNEVSWGGKFRVGSTITRIGSFYENNLIDGLYIVRNPKLNGNNLITPTHVVEKSMVFTCDTEYLLDNNEPKCILSPSRLRMPNSSYKILGHIPDISGHGNNGVINNSAYAKGSGANEDGSYQFDGVDDFVTIPTTVGGKQVLMKVNWQKSPALLYDQRASGSFAVLTTLEDDAVNPRIAYQARNQNGKTYIDGIENNNIETYTLKDITHNITIANSSLGGIIVPVIGCNTGKSSNFAKMSLYDFMLFDNISTDDKIKELNEYVGIEAKVELPPYYYDAYGKTNFDADRDSIQQRGVAVGNYDLTNYNHAYDKMSGFGGYEFAKFDNTSEWIFNNNSDTIEVVNRDGYTVVLRKVGNGTNYWHFRNTVIKSLGQDIRIGVYANKSVQIVWQLKYKLEGDTDYNTLAIASPTIEGNINTYVTLPYKTEQEIADLNAIDTYYSIYFIPIDLNIDEEVTIEMLPLYPNGLVYDGVTDYSENSNIPAFTDYTYIFKREFKNLANSATIAKSPDKLHGGAFVADYNGTSQFSFGQQNDNLPIQGISWQTKNSFNGTSINSGTNTDDKGITIGRFSTGYANIVFYKLVLYPKTIPLLQINFLKNLMERDEIIDLNNKIFIQE